MGRQELLHRREREPAARAGWRGWFRRVALLLVLGPLLAILAYRVVPPPGTPLMLIRAAQGYGTQREWVPLEAIAPALAEAVIAGEDNLFCRQSLGFDFGAMREVLEGWWAGGTPRGASTITMQTAKNLLLWPGRDPLRKALETWLTPQIALLWPRRRVLEVYLNIVELGPGLYGAEAAARALFGKPASALTRGEAVRLAAILPSPLHWSATQPSPRVAARAAAIERRMGQLGPLLDCAR